ncbi:hypothetical protein Q3304_14655 [Clostridioides sp. GD02377]|uniref:hypothetical protein n=1 Tax=unclassified Clostridioides TaxID=2635829 RepID=UPI0038A4BE4F
MNMKLKNLEIPIYFNKRLYGESKRDLIKFIFSYVNTLFRLYKIKKNDLQKEESSINS